MNLKTQKVRFAIWLCRRLPLSLAFRVRRLVFTNIVQEAGHVTFQQSSMFGPSSIEGTMGVEIDADFALYGSVNVFGMVFARACASPGDTIYEFGANIGTETISLADIVGISGRVVAVEADPINGMLLAKRIRSNSLRQVIVVQKAVAGSSGELLLRHGTKANPGLSFVTNRTPESGMLTGTIPVSAITGDELMESYGAPKVVVMDIEGAECSALRGCGVILSKARPTFFLEVDNQLLARLGAAPREVLEIFHKNDYEVMLPHTWSLRRIRNEDLDGDLHTDWCAVPKEHFQAKRRALRNALCKVRLLPRLFPS